LDKDSLDFKFGIKLFVFYIVSLIFFAILLSVKTSDDKSTHNDLDTCEKDVVIKEYLE
jgi:hypothetical protein